jgi:CHAD domain-containing protein
VRSTGIFRLLSKETRRESTRHASRLACVVREREARRGRMLKRLDRVDAEKIARRLGSVGSALESAAGEPWRRALGRRLLQRSKRLLGVMDAAGQMYAPERLHEVRIAAKKLRYGLELAADSGLPLAAPYVRTIKRAQDILGKLHDLQVLQAHIAAAQIPADPPRPESRAALDALAAHVEAQCRHLHARYLLSTPALREVPAAVRTGIVPQLAQLPRPTRSVKMGLTKPSATASVPARGAARTRGAGTNSARGGR